MVLLTGDKLSKAYTERSLLDETGFTIESGDKIGVIGVNGTGKTTLLKIIAGLESADSGSIIKSSGLRVGYLPQTPDFAKDGTVLEEVLRGVSLTSKQAKEYECKSILTRLELFDFDAKVSTLSGGQKKRVALAAALVCEVELLILDEPTNHIDSAMVTWLEEYLTRYRGAVLMVTHDRYFLDRVTNKILELDRGKLYSYTCNYTKFLELKAQREDMAVASERKRQSLIRKEVEWILQGPCGRGTKSQYRIDRLAQLKAEKVDLSKGSVDMSSVQSRLGRKIIELDGISKSFGDKHLIKDFSYLLLRTDRIGIIGPNGVGKSTLLKLIMGIIPPDSGRIELGETVKIGYFSQECEDMNPSQRPIDYIKEEAEQIETVDGVLSATQLLEKFLFTSDLQYTTISRLSGGEKRRLYLLRILITAPNILILDEPTNDLDIETLTILEDYLSTFVGAVIMVSHDRYFLDKTANRIFSFENGGIKSYMGGYTDWLIQREETDTDKPKVQKTTADSAPRKKNEKLKFTFKEAREFETIDEDISALEGEISAKEADILANASDFVRLQALGEEKAALERALEEKMSRWVYLNDLNDSING
ncbi:MAG: ABC-F family ATP-binding cassette domain-containing protein [Oscillospiraceae bacterium]